MPVLMSIDAGTREYDGIDLPPVVNELPARYRWVEAARVGRFRSTTGRHVVIEPRDLDQIATRFGRMSRAGVDIPICRNGRETADNCLGWAIRAERSGDHLYMLAQLLGDDAVDEADAARFGATLDPDFHDGVGRAYGLAIRSLAMKPSPHAAASARARRTQYLSASTEATSTVNLSLGLWGPTTSLAPAAIEFFEST